MKFLKIREKVFYPLDHGMNKIKKRNIFSNPTPLKLSFPLCHGILQTPVPEIIFGPP